MAEDNIQNPLLLNDSMKDSIQHPQYHHISPIRQLEVEPIREEPIEEPVHQPPPKELHQEIPQEVHPAASTVASERRKSKQEESALNVVESTSSTKGKIKKRYRAMQVCGLICVLIGFVLIFAIPPFVQSMIVSQAIDQVVMTHDNEGLWGRFPGDSNTIITRNFTFFRLINEEDFLLRNHKPQFQQVSGFKIQQLEDFLNITYLDNGNLVKIRDWVRFAEWPESLSLDSTVNILNMGNIGYWATLKAARPTLILQQGLALLFTNMEASILPTLLGTGISSQFLSTKETAFNSLLTPAGIDQDNSQFLWNDPAYGLNNADNLGEWAQAAINSYQNNGNSFQFSKRANKLKNYFALSDGQIEFLLQKFYGYVVNLKHILVQNHYCADIQLSKCTGRFLAIAQLADGWVTASPPPVSTISANDTICENNSTCKGYYPELYAYEKNVFWGTQNAKLVDSNSEITFTREQVEGWFDHNKTVTPDAKFNTAENCLLHIGNLDQIWLWGTDFDKSIDAFGMDKIKDRLKLDDRFQALVVWEWLKYMVHQFVRQKHTNDKLGLSNLFTQGFYEQFSLMEDTLGPLLLKKMVKNKLETKQCHLFFRSTLEESDISPLVSSLCNHYTDIHSQEFADFILSTCDEKFGPAWQQLRDRGVNLLAMEYHCEINGKDNFGTLLHNIKVQLNTLYDCSSTPNQYCSNFELAAKQWANSTITMKPPPSLAKQLPSVSSYHSWNTNVKAFEYGYFLSKFRPQQKAAFPIFTIDEMFLNINFEEWFSAPVVLKYIISGKLGQFIRYIRWLAITVTLNGFTMNRTVREILFGYTDEFLDDIKNTYPPFGGDPSAPSVIALNDLNLTQSEAYQTIVFKTGKDDFRNVYQNYEINGYRYSVNKYQWFNGNQTLEDWKSPWAEEDYFYGTTAKIFAPNQFEANNLSLLIPQVQRYGSNFFHNETFTIERFGMDLYMSFLSPYIGEVAPHNDKYYQTIPNVFNVSSIYGLPLYITKNHFMNCTEWLDLVDIFNENYTILYDQISHWDDTFIIVEPYTGVSFQSVIYLQNNYYHQPDQLYPYPTNVMLPIFSISRSGNLTEDKFHELYDPLVLGLKMKSVVLYIGIALTVVFALLFVLGTYCIKKTSKQQANEHSHSQLGISLQQQHEVNQAPTERLTLQLQD